MRLVHVISTLEKCGPVNVLYGLASHLPKDIEQSVITLAKEPAASRLEDFRSLGIEVRRLYEKRIDAVLHPKKVAEWLASQAPDIVHVHGFRACRFGSGLPYSVVATVHNDLFSDFKYEYGWIAGHLMEIVQVHDLKKIGTVVACSKSNAHILKQRYGIEASFICNGVDTSVFRRLTADERREVRHRFAMPEESFIVIATCGCSLRKRTTELISSFLRAQLSNNVVLYVLGEGSLYNRCASMADGDRVRVLGRQDCVEQWLGASDCFVSYSESEGMPMAALEAASCGLPLILSDIAPHREIAGMLSEGSVKFMTASDKVEEALAWASACSLDSSAVDVSADAMAKRYMELYQGIAGATHV